VLKEIGRLAGRQYGGTMDPADVSMRVIADHIRATTFLIADGVIPSNEFRGYVLRKIMRRAMRHGKKIGLDDPFLHQLVDVLAREMADAYPQLKHERDAVARVIKGEEERFNTVLVEGLPRLEEILDRASKGSRTISGEDAFKLYDTYGLPRDFIEDLTGAQGLRFDTDGFERAMESQREKARAKSAFSGGEGPTWNTRPDASAVLNTPDVFKGYDATRVNTQVIELLKEAGNTRAPADALSAGESGFVALAETPFYLESGGQVSDLGRLTGPAVEATVTGVVKAGGMRRFHRVQVTRGTLTYRDLVAAEVDVTLRDATRRNHTATHLLHAALRQVLGSHVKQSGSLVAPDRLRFDFVHFSALTADEIARIERIVNEQIVANTPVRTEIRDTEEAIQQGAMALFGEKYGERVRVVSVPGFSTELCGGTHVRATGDIGSFYITEETGVAANTRRVEAVTGLGAYAHARERIDVVRALTSTLNTKPTELVAAVSSHIAAASALRKEVQQLKTRLALGGGGSAAGENERVDIGGVTLIARHVTDVDKASLRSLADTYKSRLTSGVVLLAAKIADDAVAIVASVTPDVKDRVPAGRLVKELAPVVGGKGGGRPDFAEAGGKDPAKIGEMLAESRKLVERLLANA
jgi:alanyl-tRNA synthetase